MENSVEQQSDPVETPYVILKGVNTQAATPIDEHVSYVKQNINRNLPWLHNLPEFQKVKGKNKKLALVGGGPSVKRYIDDIKQFKTIMACGSTNDWCMENGIIPNYAVICDPDPVSNLYYTKQDSETKYLLATSCSPKIFDNFDPFKQVVLWNCHSEECQKILAGTEFEEKYKMFVGGGCTVGLRALSIAMCLGYQNIHMFGFDSCLDEKEHHSYEFATNQEELGVIHKIKLGSTDKPDPNSKTFYCAGYMLAQATHFLDFLKVYYQYFTPVVYGDGLIATMLNNMIMEARNIQAMNQNQAVNVGVKQ